MAGVTARMAPSGKAAMVARNQAACKRGADVEGLQNREKAAVLLVVPHLLGARRRGIRRAASPAQSCRWRERRGLT